VEESSLDRNMTKTKDQLLSIWFSIWHIPGWLRIIEMTKDYDQEDLEYLEAIDTRAIVAEKESERYYWEIELPKARKQIEEFKKEFDSELKRERRLEFLNNQIEKLQKEENRIWLNHQEATERDLPHWLRQAILEIQKPWKLAGKIKSFQVEIYLLDHPEDFLKVDRVSSEQVAKALEFPFKDLIQLNKAGFALCPFHSEKRSSFYVKNNWGYCFGCQWHGTTIDFLKSKNNLSFKEAVRALQ